LRDFENKERTATLLGSGKAIPVVILMSEIIRKKINVNFFNTF